MFDYVAKLQRIAEGGHFYVLEAGREIAKVHCEITSVATEPLQLVRVKRLAVLTGVCPNLNFRLL